MINPALSQRMSPPRPLPSLERGAGGFCPPVLPTTSWGPWLSPQRWADAAPHLCPGTPGHCPFPVPLPVAASTRSTRTPLAVSPQAGGPWGTRPQGRMPWGPHRQGGAPVPCAKQGGGTPPSPGPAAGWGLPTCSRCSIKLPPLPSHRFLIPGSQSAPPANGRAAPQNPERHWAPPGMSPMAFTALLLLLLLGAGEGLGPMGPRAGGSRPGTRASGELTGQGTGAGSPGLLSERGPGGCQSRWPSAPRQQGNGHLSWPGPGVQHPRSGCPQQIQDLGTLLWPRLLLAVSERIGRAVPGPAGADSRAGMQVCPGEPSGPRALLQCRRLLRHPLGNRPGAARAGRQPGRAGPGWGAWLAPTPQPSDLQQRGVYLGGGAASQPPQHGRVPSGAEGILQG